MMTMGDATRGDRAGRTESWVTTHARSIVSSRSFASSLPRAISQSVSHEDDVSGGVQRRAGGWMGVRVGASVGSDDDGGDDDDDDGVRGV